MASGTARQAVDVVSDFLSSMPEAYREAFPNDAAEHAMIVARRGSKSAHLERCGVSADGSSVVCVVADDCPGLLSTICRVFMARELDIVMAQVHCRKRREGPPPEAVDLFWLRPRSRSSAGGLTDEVVEALARDVEVAVQRNGQSTLPPGHVGPSGAFGSAPSPRVFFNTNALRRGEVVLIVEALDCPGLLHSISLALHREGIEITSSDIRTEGKIARDSFVLVGPGSKPFTSERLAAVRQVVVDAVRKRLLEVQAAG
jgi:UTP:GlnB (protein PII) uridylyltransferase